MATSPAGDGTSFTRRVGLYDPSYEHDGCGIGFVAHARGERSPDIVRSALELLENLSHRSAVGADAETGDGAGMLVQIPHAFLWHACRTLGISLPDAGAYGVGMLFLPANEQDRSRAERAIEAIVHDRGCRVLGWRDVPVDESCLGRVARDARPAIRQLFIAPFALDLDVADASSFERTLYVLRRCIESRAREAGDEPLASSYVASLSSRTIVYKGMLRPSQLRRFYHDLTEPDFASALALVHSRFSTNTFPSWPLAHPYRYVCHNGEINTLRGNLAWMRARESLLASPQFGADIAEIVPIVGEGQSDSACFDNVLELLVQAGRPLAHAMMMLVPEAWENDDTMPAERRAFYEYHASLLEPWDGPAAMAFTDGRQIGAVLDRNGLRPARYVVTNDDIVVLASEAGALSFPPDQIRVKGRLQPGRMLLVNTTQGRIVEDTELKEEIASLRPYRRWVAEQRVKVPELRAEPHHPTREWLVRRQAAFGYTSEELRMVLAPMAAHGEEPVGSMGNDAPLAVLSDRPQLLFAYFRQVFAQVTNPAIDPIRERLVMSLKVPLGAQRNLLDETPEHAHQVQLEHPVLTSETIGGIRALSAAGLVTRTLSTLFEAADGASALEAAVERLCREAIEAVNSGCEILILSDVECDARRVAIPALLATASVHHALLRQGLRARASLVVETGEVREVAHYALLVGYGASAIHPYIALATVADLATRGELPADVNSGGAQSKYTKAVGKGLLKILSKMGISTLQSFCGAQLCEAIGLDDMLIARHFSGTTSAIGGIGFETIAAHALERHATAFSTSLDVLRLDGGGEYHYRVKGEHHAWNPLAIAKLQHATRSENVATFAEFSALADEASVRGRTLRGLLDFATRDPVPIDEVEPASSIVKRFVTGAMSFGSLSREAHETLAIAMNRLGGRSNTGEGGEERERFGTERNSAIKQVASARFGVTTEYLVNASELQIKIAQGAKPGEGGQLPGDKVDEVIARTRHATAGVTLISPPPHHDIYSIEDLAQLIHDLKSVNPAATVSVKLVSESGIGTVAAGVVKARADLITISGDSGGTGASPLSSIKRAGIPWELGLAETQQTLVMNGLRGRVRLQTDGQLKTGRDVVVAALLGADEFGFATAPLIVAGCVMMRKCHLNTCPVGVATQDPVLRAKFSGRPEHVINYFFFVAEEVRALLALLGLRTMDEAIGRVDLLRPRVLSSVEHSSTLNLSALLHRTASVTAVDERRHMGRRAGSQDRLLDDELIRAARPALEQRQSVTVSLPIRTSDRAVGAKLSGEIARRLGRDGLPDESIVARFVGSAGQSFGAFAMRGLSLELEGEANDYVGKGLSGARLVVRAPKASSFLPDETVIVGNTVLYGATSGEAYFGGLAGERFAVRNSGAMAVVEGVGNHGCEYMTGGVVVVLGRTGRNFAAGMSGGIALVLDEGHGFEQRCNRDLVELGPVVDVEHRDALRYLLERHVRFTGSPRARHVLTRWEQSLRQFVLVMPTEYRKALVRDRAASITSREQSARHG